MTTATLAKPISPSENPEAAMSGYQTIAVPLVFERLTEEDKSDWLDRFLRDFDSEYGDMMKRLAD